MPLDLEVLKNNLVSFFVTQPEIAGVYLFGSLADGKAHANSDVDIAVLFKPGLSFEFYRDQQLYLGGKLCEVLGRDDVDVIILNRTHNSELEYNVIQDGELIVGDHSTLIDFEVRVKNEYYDHMAALKRAGFE